MELVDLSNSDVCDDRRETHLTWTVKVQVKVAS